MNKIILIILFFSITISAFSQQERKYIRKGNREYSKATIDSLTTDTVRYQNAEVLYRKAIEEDPNNWDASYNLANSLFKQGKFEESTRQFQAVAGMQNDNKEHVAQAFHNLGNSFLQTNKLSEAIEAYKNSLRNNPNDFDTKYNLAWAQNKLNEQQQQQDQNKDSEDNKDKEQQDKEQQDKEKEDKQEQEQKDQQQQEKEQQQQQQEKPQENQISKEDAMRILEALQNDEKEVQEKVQKQKVQPKKRSTQKDW
ncbi:MAG: tetratricopeptide repeat protein [Salinivirgaceae bacterium]|jgi:Ca-activated chloride channel family protein|nr:tetratricopeptide repeat protein [Salinivirgaceae bacterium]